MSVRQWAAWIFFALAMPVAATAQSATEKALTAQSVNRDVVLQLRADGKSLSVALDNGEYAPLRTDQTFLARRTVRVSFYHLNPMRTLVTVGVTDADDPSHATIGSLVQALLGVVTSLAPEAAAGALKGSSNALLSSPAFIQPRNLDTPDPCVAERQAFNALADRLAENLYAEAWMQKTIRDQLKAWDEAIQARPDGRSWNGPDALDSGMRKIEMFRSSAPVRRKNNELEKKSLKAIVDDATKAIGDLEAKVNPPAPLACQELRPLYQLMYLTDPGARLVDIKKIAASVDGLYDALKAMAPPVRWSPKDRYESYILNEDVEPSRSTIKVVSVKVASVDYSKIDEVVPVVVSKTTDIASGTFRVQKHSFFLPEAGVGATFVRVPFSKYGTTNGTNGGTVVGEPTVEQTKVEPSVMVNFVCRCGPAPVLTPMFQLGVSTSKELPAILVGGGLRIFHAGKGDFGLGYGYVSAFQKVPKSLKPGDKAGTADLEKNLEYQRIKGFHHYVTLQYKFTL